MRFYPVLVNESDWVANLCKNKTYYKSCCNLKIEYYAYNLYI